VAAIAARKQQERRLNASDATPGTATEERPSSDRPAPAESADPAPGNTQRSQEAVPPGDAPSDAPSSEDSAPRPRRRRRRRRRPPHLAGASSDRQPGEGLAAEPAGEGAPGEAGAPQQPETGAEGGPQRNTLRLRNWRRRHRMVRPAPRLGEAEGSPPSTETGSAAATTNTEGAAGNRNPLRARRRRRRPPIAGPGDSREIEAGEAAPGEAPGDVPTRPLGTRPPRSRNRRRRRPAATSAGTPAAGDSANAATAPSEHRPARRDRDHRGRDRQGDGPRDPDQRSRGPRDRDRRDGGARGEQRGRGRGPPGRDRGPTGRKIERKLYSVDSVVDRGFDDVDEEAGTRRVHWTILKRTTADQISRKPVSAVYVLQRDGNDSEFPNLGAARSAVNKTIVHPEKLTRSKEEYAAEKSGKR
jgi:hypothetical protein